jgi:hypothetical protein
MPHPTRPCRCNVGRHPEAAAIDAALVAGGAENSCLKLEARYRPLSKSAIGRHRKECLGLGTGAGTPSQDAPASQAAPAAEPPAAEPAAPRKRRIGEPPPGCPTKEQRVNIIIGLMARLEWVTGETGPQLAEKWGIHHGTLEHDANEASRAVKRQVDPGAVQAVVLAALHEGLELALNHARPQVVGDVVLPGDPRALNPLANIAKAMNIFAPAPARVAPAATGERAITVHYAEGLAPTPPPDGPPLQPPPVEGTSVPRSWP